MGITKTEGFSSEVIEMADLLKAIGHPARLSILKKLAENESCVCGDLVLDLPLAQPTVSRHLKELKQVGLIKGQISGNNICYCIDQNQWKRMLSFLYQIEQNVQSLNSCC